MAKIFMGIRIPNKTYERIPLDNIDVEQNISYLRNEVAKKINFPNEEIELIYCGRVLEDNEIISGDIKPGSTVHVFKKTTKLEPYVSNSYKDEDYQKIAEMFGTVTGVSLSLGSRMNILSRILTEYPEFRRNLGAQALIRDSVLFQSLKKPEVIQKVAQNYAVICDAAEFIVKTIKKEITKNETITFSEESLSDLTSSSEEESSNTSQTEQARIRRISRDQLAAALMLAGSASLNSLSNIAQRNTNMMEEQQRQQPNPTTSSSSSTLSNAPPLRISSSIFNNALSQALMTSTTPRSERNSQQLLGMDTTETQTAADETSSISSASEASRTRYATELQIMREMGLTRDTENLSALMLTEGNVESAINLVFRWHE